MLSQFLNKEQDLFFKQRKDPDMISSFRPIALSSCLVKIGEHLVKNRLDWYIESNEILPEFQYGFRKGRSTLDSLAIFTCDIRLAFTENKFITAAFLDICAAYDNVQIPFLMDKLHNIGVPPKTFLFIKGLLTERSITLKSDNPCVEASRTVLKVSHKDLYSVLSFSTYMFMILACASKLQQEFFSMQMILFYTHLIQKLTCRHRQSVTLFRPLVPILRISAYLYLPPKVLL